MDEKKRSIKLKIKRNACIPKMCWLVDRGRSQQMQNKFSLVPVFQCFCRFSQHIRYAKIIFFHSLVQTQRIFTFCNVEKKIERVFVWKTNVLRIFLCLLTFFLIESDMNSKWLREKNAFKYGKKWKYNRSKLQMWKSFWHYVENEKKNP